MLTTYPFDDEECCYCTGSKHLFDNPGYGPCLCDVPEILRGFHMANGTGSKRGRKPMTEEEKAAKEAAKQNTLALVSALDFVAPAAKDQGEPYATHAAIIGKWLSTYDGTTMLATPVEEEFTCYPNFTQLRKALDRAGDKLKLVVTGGAQNARLQISSGKFRVTIPCEPDGSVVMRPQPEPATVPVEKFFIEALKQLVTITTEGAPDVAHSSIHVRNGTCTALDGCLILQKFHHTYFATEFALPRSFVVILQKIKREPTWYGLSDVGFTLWFDDGSFIRTKLYDPSKWPSYDHVWPTDYNAFDFLEIPEGFYDAVRDCVPFVGEHGAVVFDDGAMRTHDVEDVGAVVTLKDIQRSKRFYSAKRLLKLEGVLTHFDYNTDERGLLVGYGDATRGLLSAHAARSDMLHDPEEVAHIPAAPAPQAAPPTGFAAPEAADVPQDAPPPPVTDLAAVVEDVPWQPPPINLPVRERSDVLNGAEQPSSHQSEANAWIADAMGDTSDPEPGEDEDDNEHDSGEATFVRMRMTLDADDTAANGASNSGTVPKQGEPPKGYDWQPYYDETNSWFINGTEWGRAGYQADANPAQAGTEEYKYWYEGWRSVGSPRT